MNKNNTQQAKMEMEKIEDETVDAVTAYDLLWACK